MSNSRQCLAQLDLWKNKDTNKIGVYRLPKHLDLVNKSERPSRGYLTAERAILHRKFAALSIYERVREVDHALDLESFGGFDGHLSVALFELDLG